MPMPQYLREGWRRAGPGMCRCPVCFDAVSTNALGRSAHKINCRERMAKAARATAEKIKADASVSQQDLQAKMTI